MENLNCGQRYALIAGTFLVASILATGAQAQPGYYKWTDKDGQVHYSQNPPPERKQGEVERITIKINKQSQSTEPQASHDEQKSTRILPDCGSITFPKQMLNPVDRIAQLKADMALWQKYVDENSASTDKKIQQRIKDFRCAIDYSKGELETLSNIEETIEDNYQQVRDELEEIHQKVEACNDPQQRDEGTTATQCSQQYSKRISELEKMKRSLEASNKTLNQGE